MKFRTSAILAFASFLPVTANAAMAVWSTASGGNGHTYEIVIGNYDWTTARSLAEGSTIAGSTGYLATITSAEEQAFLDALFSPRTISTLPDGQGGTIDFSSLWLGGSDADVEGVWRWVAGPESGQLISDYYENWDTAEPNDFPPGEDYLAGWFRADRGDVWNDLPSNANDFGQFVVGYIVEYDTNVIPLPGAAWLLLGGLGALGFARSRRT